MKPIVTYSPSVRQAVSDLMARCFLVHLRTEVGKPDSVLLEDYPELPVRDLTRKMIEKVQTEFGIGADEELPPDNLIERWCILNGKFEYEDSAFFGLNRMYFWRLMDLRDGTVESRERHYTAMRSGFDQFDYENHGFTVAFFLDSETNMSEVMRATVHKYLPEFGVEADGLVLSQSRAFRTAMYEYFEGILKATLAENVRLLHGILPEPVASELKSKGFVEPVQFDDAAVLFTDFEKFSQFTANLPPSEVLHRLDTYFTEFDRVAAIYGLEKIKTIGDSYMAVAGVPQPHSDPVRATCNAALEILEASDLVSEKYGHEGWRIRIGIHVGPLMAGVIGKQKFAYDVWGATVNFASRMESSGEPGRINVSAEIHERVENDYLWESRGFQPVKRLGLAEMFFLRGRKPELAGAVV